MPVDLRRTNLTRAPLPRTGSLLVIGLMWSLLDLWTARAESQNGHLSRLGFTFDPTPHNAAQKKAQHPPTASDEPAPAGVLRLPKYTVVEKSIVVESDELLTPKGKVDLAKKLYLAPMYQKTIGPLLALASLLANPLGGWNPNAPEAMAIYEDFKQRDRNNQMADLNDLSELADRAKQLEALPRAAPKK